MFNSSFRLDRHETILELMLENEPDPIAAKDSDEFHNNDGTQLVTRQFAHLLRHDDGITKLYLITQDGRDYLEEIKRYKDPTNPVLGEGNYDDVLRTFEKELRHDLYIRLVLYLTEHGIMDKIELEVRLEMIENPLSKAMTDALSIFPATFPLLSSPKSDTTKRFKHKGVVLSQFDLDNMKTVGKYLDRNQADGTFTNVIIYALQVAAQVTKAREHAIKESKVVREIL